MTNESGSIDFLYMKNLPRTLIHCVWLIQTPDSRYIKLNFTKFVFNKRNSDCNRTKLSVFEGTVASAVSNSVDFCYSKRPNKEVVMAGPYITVSLVTHGNRVQNSGFRMSYEYKNTGKSSHSFYIILHYLSISKFEFYSYTQNENKLE